MTFQNVTVDVCQNGCGGVWLDAHEFKKVDEQHEQDGDILARVTLGKDVEKAPHAKRKCPKCPNMIMLRRFESPLKQVYVDECPKCAGIWLDAGELLVIRSQYKTEDERKAAASRYFDGLFGGQMATERAKTTNDTAKSQNFARALRFICPSYYLPRKQKGGAF